MYFINLNIRKRDECEAHVKGKPLFIKEKSLKPLR